MRELYREEEETEKKSAPDLVKKSVP